MQLIGGSAEPAVHDSGVDRPEIGRIFQIALVLILEVHGVAPVTALHVVGDDELRRRGAVICAVGAILGDAPAKTRSTS